MPLSGSERICVVAAAAASEVNDELTIILCSAEAAIAELPFGHPVRRMVIDIQTAGTRAASTASGLLRYSARNGGRPSSATFDHLADEK